MCRPRLVFLMLAIIVTFSVSYSASAKSIFIAPYESATMEITSNRHVQSSWNTTTVESFLDTEGFRLVSQTDAAELWLSEAYHTLRLVDRRTGYVWGAIPLEDARNLNKSWRSYGSSIVSIECYDTKNNEKRYGLLDNAVVNYHLLENGFAFNADYRELGITFSGHVTLSENKVTFELEEGSLIETGAYRLKSLAFMPYLGAVFEDEMEGWFLLPDGPGALMRFQRPGSYIAGFDKKIYGKDLGIDQLTEAQSLNANRPNDYVIASSQILMPVYGIVHGTRQNGLLCVIEDGEQYASIVATPAGLGNTKYNSIMTRFECRQKYNRFSNRSGAGTPVPQERTNVLTPKQSLYLLSGEQADYDQMAVFYRELLSASDALPNATDDMKLRLEILGADVKQLALWKTHRTFTTLSETREMVLALQESGVHSLSVVLRNYTSGNLAGESLNDKVGTAQELADLQTLLSKNGSQLLLYLDPMRANKDQMNQRLQAANAMNTSPIRIWRDNPDAIYQETFFFRPRLIEDKTRQHLVHFAEYGVAADQLGSRLFGDYTSGRESTRAENTPKFLALTQTLKENGVLALYLPNQIMWPYADSFYDLPLVNGQYLYETDTVPFLPIVLKGHMALYAPTLNTGAFNQDRILRMIEYGAYPSFIVTAAESIELTNTPLEDLYSTCFDDWKEYIVETYLYMHMALEKVAGLRIVAHEAIDTGWVQVTYEGGKSILLNYTENVWRSEYGAVAPHDYLIWEGGKD